MNLLNETFGSALGQRYVTKETQTTLKKLATGKGELADVQDLLSAYADKTSFALNMPERGDFFRIKSNDGSRYITTDGAAAGEWQLKTTTGTPDENTIFCFDGTNLVSLKTGRAVYLSNNKSQAKLAAYDVATPATVEFGELADGKYKVILKQGNQKATVHLWQDARTTLTVQAATIRAMCSLTSNSRKLKTYPFSSMPMDWLRSAPPTTWKCLPMLKST